MLRIEADLTANYSVTPNPLRDNWDASARFLSIIILKKGAKTQSKQIYEYVISKAYPKEISEEDDKEKILRDLKDKYDPRVRETNQEIERLVQEYLKKPWLSRVFGKKKFWDEVISTIRLKLDHDPITKKQERALEYMSTITTTAHIRKNLPLEAASISKIEEEASKKPQQFYLIYKAKNGQFLLVQPPKQPSYMGNHHADFIQGALSRKIEFNLASNQALPLERRLEELAIALKKEGYKTTITDKNPAENWDLIPR